MGGEGKINFFVGEDSWDRWGGGNWGMGGRGSLGSGRQLGMGEGTLWGADGNCGRLSLTQTGQRSGELTANSD